MVSKKLLFILALLFGLILSACAPGEEPDLPETGDGELPPQAALQATQELSTQLGISTAEIEIVETEQMDWPDACLGLPETGEACAQVITPGFRVVLEANGQEYVYRTDVEGDVVRLVEEQE